jgi:hypothetical protein
MAPRGKCGMESIAPIPAGGFTSDWCCHGRELDRAGPSNNPVQVFSLPKGTVKSPGRLSVMKNLTHPAPENTIPLHIFPSGEEGGNGGSCLLSVLCVSEDPLFLDGIRQNLEQNSDIFVEISVQAEDALHLMEYLSFDAIVTDCISLHGEPNGFPKTLRKQGMEIPFIFFLKGMMTGSMKDIRGYGHVRYLVWGEKEATPPFDELIRCIREMTAKGAGEKARNAFGWPQTNGERIV